MATKKEMQNVECNCNENFPCCSGYVPGVGSVIFKPSQLAAMRTTYNITSYSKYHVEPSSSAVLKTVAQTVVNSQTPLPTVSTTPIVPKPIIPTTQAKPTPIVMPTVDMRIFQPINPGPIPNSKPVAPAPKPKDNIFVAFWRRLFG